MVRPPPRPRIAEETFEDRYLAWGGLQRGTRPEFIVWDWLVRRKRLVEGTDFRFQSSRWGGRMMFGGAIVDFYFPGKNMVWRVMGEYFHLRRSEDRAHDEIQRIQLLQEGLIVVDLWVADLFERREYVLNLAWEGREAPTYDIVRV